jgi:hypothetical protein
MQLNSQDLVNIIQVVVMIVGVVGITVAIVNGRKDRAAAFRLAAADRYSAEERALEDRSASEKQALADRRHGREQIQQNFRLQQSLQLARLLFQQPPMALGEATQWNFEVKANLYTLSHEELPITWSHFVGPDGKPEALSDRDLETMRQEVLSYLEQAAREAACHSCFHDH